MRVKYKIFDKSGYLACCAMIEDLYPNDSPPTMEEYTKSGTGEIVGFIKGGFWSDDKFIIADDKTGVFINVRVTECIKISD